MNMTLSKRGDYVVRSALALARVFDSGEPRKIREVVAETDLPPTFASQILADLVRAGLAVSKAGRDGGYWLARPPRDISILEVIEAAEGPLRAERCALGEVSCRWEQVCPLHETWSAATAALRDLLGTTTLADVAARDEAIESGTYEAPADSHRSHAVAVDVVDMVQVELAEAAARGALAAAGTGLRPLVDAAVAEAAQTGPHRSSASADAVATVCSLAPERARRREEPTSFVLGWRLAGPPGPSHFEATLLVTAVDEERSELQLSGSWHQYPSADKSFTSSELERLARRAVRGVLRRLARTLEEAAGGHGPTEMGNRRRVAAASTTRTRRGSG